MADHSKIEWTEATWNPVVGCTHVSPGCDNCYAARDASARLAHTPRYAGLAVAGRFTGEVRLVPEVLDKPLRWRRPRRVFVNSMSDLFHHDIPNEYIARVFAAMALTGRHTFQLLTKRHRRMWSLLRRPSFYGEVVEQVTELISSQPWHRWQLDLGGQRLAGDSGHGAGWTATTTPDGTMWSPPWPLPNVWGGVSVEDQHWAGIRIPVLLDTPLAVRWISAEPLLGPVDLHWCAGVDAIEQDWVAGMGAPHPLLDWVVVGGETGPGARAMRPWWARALRDQCIEAGVPFFFKQWGEWAPGCDLRPPELIEQPPEDLVAQEHVYRVGKKRAGNLLDGQTWEQYPEAVTSRG